MSHFSFTGWFTSALARSRRLPRQARPQKALPRPRFAPRLEVLEDRTVPSTFTVTSLADAGPRLAAQHDRRGGQSGDYHRLRLSSIHDITLAGGQWPSPGA